MSGTSATSEKGEAGKNRPAGRRGVAPIRLLTPFVLLNLVARFSSVSRVARFPHIARRVCGLEACA